LTVHEYTEGIAAVVNFLPLVWGAASAAFALVSVARAADDPIMTRIYAHCPHYAAAEKEVASGTPTHAPTAESPSLPALRRELLLLKDQDQDARQQAIAGGDGHEVQDVDARNLNRLRTILSQGLPTAREVGPDGVGALWLLIQHADDDPTLQAKALSVFEARTGRGEFPRSSYALLYDRVRLAQGKPQRYGSQMRREANTFQPEALEDPAHVDARRRAMGLVPLEDYRCSLEAVYGVTP
jgi:hypothetical protein